MSDIVTFDVGGKLFKTCRSTFEPYPVTDFLPTLLSKDKRDVIFIDRNPKTFAYILDYYRTGILDTPSHIGKDLWTEECKFYFPSSEIEEVKGIGNWEMNFPIYLRRMVNYFLSYVNGLTVRHNCIYHNRDKYFLNDETWNLIIFENDIYIALGYKYQRQSHDPDSRFLYAVRMGYDEILRFDVDNFDEDDDDPRYITKDDKEFIDKFLKWLENTYVITRNKKLEKFFVEEFLPRKSKVNKNTN